MHCLLTIVTVALLSTTVVAVSSTVAYPQPTQTCVSGAHIIIARASLEQQGEGILSAVASSVIKAIPSSDAVAVVYPATESNYQFSEQEGVVGMKQLVTDYVSRCPNNKVILMGYSQGAQVVGDTVIGCDDKNFSDDTTNPTGLGTQYLDNIAALIMMGDPAFNTGCPSHVGNATQNGFFPRQNCDAFAKYGLDSKMQSYCDAGDQYCASGTGSNATAIHVGYVAEYGSSAASFVEKMFASATVGAGSGGSGSGSASATSTSGGSGSGGATTTTAAAAAGGSGSGASSIQSNNPLTSNRYVPDTTTFSGTFSQPGNGQGGTANFAGVQTMDKGIAGALFGAAMFVMGLL